MASRVNVSRAIIGISRGPFLILSVVLIASSTAAAAMDGTVVCLHAALALVGLVSLHVAVNVFNEAGDTVSGIDFNTHRTPFSGGSGILPSGLLTVKFAYLWALGAAGVGALVGAFFVWRVGPEMWPILIFGAVSVLGYTRFWLRIGIGEIVAGLGLGLFPVVGSAMVHPGGLGPAAWSIAVPAFLMTFNLLLLAEFPDADADRIGGRRHLVILCGRVVAARIYAAVALLVPACIAGAVVVGSLPRYALLGILPTLILVRVLKWAFREPEEAVRVPALAANVAWNLSTHVVLGIAIVAAL